VWKIPEFTEPNEGYGLVYHEALGAAALLLKLELKAYVIMERL
jgi:hypothetical protein